MRSTPMNRIVYLDRVKAIGMVLVFYGHFIEKLYFAGAAGVLIQWKIVYAVHMPLFFFLAGVFWKPGRRKFVDTLFVKIKTRLLPIAFFSLIALPFWFLSAVPAVDIARRAKQYLYGSPSLNWLCWFLFCLFTMEILLAVFSRLFKTAGRGRVMGFTILCFLFGWVLASVGERFSLATGFRFNFWYFDESFTAAGFYLSGYLFKDVLGSAARWTRDIAVLLGSGILFFATFNLNHGPFEDGYPVAMMAVSRHGNPVLFAITALAGIVFIVWLLRLISLIPRVPMRVPMPGIKPDSGPDFTPNSMIDFVGRNTILYLGLNGLCYHFFDKWVFNAVGYTPDSAWLTLGYTLLYSVVMIALFGPMVWLLRRYVPELTGLSWTKTSMIPRMGWE